MECLAIVHANEEHWLYDADKAEDFWKQAAERNDIEAMYDLGLFYYRGRKDRAADVVSGHYWMKRCAAAGHPLAIKFLKVKKFFQFLFNIFHNSSLFIFLLGAITNLLRISTY